MGSVSEVEELFRAEYARLVRALAVAFDAETAADAVQEAFLEADRRWGRIGSYTDPAAWVRRVAINRASNARRNQRRRREILDGIRVVPVDDLTESLVDLRRAVAELPAAMRLALCLHYLPDTYSLDYEAPNRELLKVVIQDLAPDAWPSMARAVSDVGEPAGEVGDLPGGLRSAVREHDAFVQAIVFSPTLQLTVNVVFEKPYRDPAGRTSVSVDQAIAVATTMVELLDS